MALEMKAACETCGAAVGPEGGSGGDGGTAYICSYECTFCAHCTETTHHHICPNCGGELVPRPQRIP